MKKTIGIAGVLAFTFILGFTSPAVSQVTDNTTGTTATTDDMHDDDGDEGKWGLLGLVGLLGLLGLKRRDDDKHRNVNR